MNYISELLLARQPEVPLTIANLRMSCPFLLLVTHQAIREQLDFRKTMKESYIMVDTPRTNSSRGSGSGDGSGESPSSAPGSENVAKLEELHLQSVDVVLNSCRSQMEMYQVRRDVTDLGMC